MSSCLTRDSLGEQPEINPIQQKGLKRYASIQPVYLILSIVTGFALTVVVTDGALRSFGAQRINIVSELVSNAVAQTDPKRRQIVLVGSSQTKYDIDGDLLEKLLNENGRRFQIIQLGVDAPI